MPTTADDVHDPITVVLVDDHPLFHAGLRQLLEADGIEIVGEASSAEVGVGLVERHAPDVAIVDPAMPGAFRIDAIRRMAASGRRTHVLALASPAPEDDVVAVVLEGSSCYLLKEAPPETILAGVRAAAQGDAMISPQIAGALVHRLRANGLPEGPEPGAVLSKREKQVLRLVVDGKENDEIARELFISRHTVKNHISSILLKLRVSNRIQAAVCAVRAAIV
jgi:DNA-binding NarL/FixJ family response regulator